VGNTPTQTRKPRIGFAIFARESGQISNFLPDVAAKDAIQPAAPTENLEGDILLGRRILEALAQRPERIPSSFIAQIIDQVQVSNILVPIGQIVGFTPYANNIASQGTALASTVSDVAALAAQLEDQFTILSDFVATQQSTTSNTYTSLATAGPQITGVDDGSYLVVWGFTGHSSAGTDYARMGIKVDTTEPVDFDSCITAPTTFSSVSRAKNVVLTGGGNHTLLCRYRVDSGTGTFSGRWMLAFKYLSA
jgi:hypothetical protein